MAGGRPVKLIAKLGERALYEATGGKEQRPRGP
jgi:hypothetical protein